MKHNVTCIILNYNDAETTLGLLDYIKDFDSIDQILIVDNCSIDNSLRKLQSHASKKISVIETPKNGGYGYGNNYGMRYAIKNFGSDYLIIANPDVFFENEAIEKFKDFLDYHNEYAIVTGCQQGKKSHGWKEVNVVGDLLYNSIILNKIFNPREYSLEYFTDPYSDVYAVPGCFFMIKTFAMEDIGFYDEDFFLFEEEKVIAKKLKAKGWKSAVLNDVEYVHNHSVSISKSIKKLGEAKGLVLKSNKLYLHKYLGVSPKKMKLISVFHKYCVIESQIIEVVRRIKKRYFKESWSHQ